MQRIVSHAKGLFLCLLSVCSLQVSAQYLEHMYDYIENTSVFEEGQEEGHAYYPAPDHLSLTAPWRTLQNASMACVNASRPVIIVVNGGTVMVSSGSTMQTSG